MNPPFFNVHPNVAALHEELAARMIAAAARAGNHRPGLPVIAAKPPGRPRTPVEALEAKAASREGSLSRVLAAVSPDQRQTGPQIAAKLGMSKSYAKRLLQDLEHRGDIVRAGPVNRQGWLRA